MIPAEATLLRLYVNADDRVDGRPLYEAVVTKARLLGLAGASVFPVEIGYGGHRRLHDRQSEYLFVGIPVVVEVVDGPERIDELLDALGSMVAEGLATTRRVRVVRYVHGGRPAGGGGEGDGNPG